MEDSKYVEWLENLVILLAKCYQETHDMLLEKAKNKAVISTQSNGSKSCATCDLALLTC